MVESVRPSSRTGVGPIHLGPVTTMEDAVVLAATSTADLDELCGRLRTATTAVLARDPDYEPLPFGTREPGLHQPAATPLGAGTADGAGRADADRLGPPADARRGHPPRPALPVERARLAAAHGLGSRARNRSRSTTTRVTSPCPTTLLVGLLLGDHLEAHQPPVDVRHGGGHPRPRRRPGWRRRARAGRGCRRWSARRRARRSTAAQVAASHQASSRGVASTGRLARPEGDARCRRR